MHDLTLVIGNRNYSSWSLRPWILLRHLDLPFRTIEVRLDAPHSKREIASWNPAGRVPLLRDGALAIWDSLAIAEYACELAARGWPRDRAARAVARAVSAEMHAGFAVLRAAWPMNARATGRKTPMTPALAADIARIEQSWADCRGRFGSEGPWLFGDYSVADAMYAPVALRFRTYGAALGGEAAHYLAHALADPILGEWMAAAVGEPWTIEHEEVGR